MMACLGDASRFRLVRLLVSGERCVTALAGEVGLSQSCTTRHLQALQREGLVCGARDGKRVLYRLCTDDAEVRSLVGWVLQSPPADPAAATATASSPGTPGQGRAREGANGNAPRVRRRRRARSHSELDHAPIMPEVVDPGSPDDASYAGEGQEVHEAPALRPGDLEDWLL